MPNTVIDQKKKKKKLNIYKKRLYISQNSNFKSKRIAKDNIIVGLPICLMYFD